MRVKVSRNMEVLETAHWLSEEMQWVKDEILFRLQTDELALESTHHLVESRPGLKISKRQ
jgi:hypothetical protein